MMGGSHRWDTQPSAWGSAQRGVTESARLRENAAHWLDFPVRLAADDRWVQGRAE